MATHSDTPRAADRRPPRSGDFLDRTTVAALGADELIARIKALQPLIAARSGDAAASRKPDDQVWQALRDSGMFYLFVPKSFGGMEGNFETFIDIGLAIAECDAATAWTATFCTEHNLLLTLFPQQAQEQLWNGDYPYVIAPFTSSPPGLAVAVPGGYRVNAHWKWATGVMHADWVMGVAVSLDETGLPVPLVVLAPADVAEVPDTWFMEGMEATGSNDVILRDVFIPEHMVARNVFRGGRTPTTPGLENPIYSAPVLPFLAMSAAIPAVGAARSMLKYYQERIKTQVRADSTTVVMDKTAAQIRLARAALLVQTAELMIRDAGKRMMNFQSISDDDHLAQRVQIRAQVAQAVVKCREAAIMLVEGAGTSVHVAGHAFNRAMRDIITVSTHIVFDYDAAMEQYGRNLVGLAPNNPFN